MQIKKRNVARLASLSALGAGALGVTAGTAQADTIIYHPVTPAVEVGFGGQATFKATFGLDKFSVCASWGHGTHKTRSGFPAPATFWRVNVNGKSQVRFEGSGGFLRLVGLGQEWAGGAGFETLHVATRGMTSSFFSFWSEGNNPSDKYALFRFSAAGGYDYGWLELSSVVSPRSGPLVTVEGWAYDDTLNEPIPAGDTGVPEPSTMALTGLAALAVGAAGLRRWRVARKAAA